MRSNLSIIFDNFDQEVDTLIRRSTFKINYFQSFDLLNVLLVTSSIMRSKLKKALLANFDLMNNLLAASAIMRSKVFMHRWLIIRANN
jgi:hypothetical protein